MTEFAERKEIFESLKPLFEKAERENLWFQCTFQPFRLTPKELRKYQSSGEMIWGVQSWELIDPRTLLKNPEAEKQKAIEHNEKLFERGCPRELVRDSFPALHSAGL